MMMDDDVDDDDDRANDEALIDLTSWRWSHSVLRRVLQL